MLSVRTGQIWDRQSLLGSKTMSVIRSSRHAKTNNNKAEAGEYTL